MRTVSLKQAVVAGFAALAVTGSAVGLAATYEAPIAQAQTAPNSTPGAQQPPAGPRQKPDGQPGQRGANQEQFLNTLAGKLGVSVDRLRQAMEETRNELGLTHRGPGGPGGRGGPHMGLDEAARAIGISVDQLRQELPGKSLADVAQAHNVQPSTVAQALKSAANARIDQEAQAGRIPSDRVAQAKQRAAERIDQMMTRQMPAGGPPQRGPRPQSRQGQQGQQG